MEMRNIRLTIEYDGSRYHGWQSPKKESNTTLSGRITEVLRRMTGEEVVLFCGEKTEPGVHAIRQIVNFKTASKMSEAEIRQYMNQYLPLDIVIRDVKTVSERFHAELNPHIITYGYRLLVGDTEDVFQRKYVDFRTEMPDIEQMQIAAEQFKGKHDFRVFSTGKTKKSTMRELTDLQILSTDLGTSCLDECRFFRTDGSYMNYKEVLILIKANGFLKQMPQKIIGILLDIGYKRRKLDCIERIFDGSETVFSECKNYALFLEKIEY